MGPMFGLGMSGQREVHRIPVGAQGRKEHNKRLLLPVMGHISEESGKRRRRMSLARIGLA